MIRKESALYHNYQEIISFLARIHLVPRKIETMIRRMHSNCESYIEAEEKELITLNWKYVTQKPEQS